MKFFISVSAFSPPSLGGKAKLKILCAPFLTHFEIEAGQPVFRETFVRLPKFANFKKFPENQFKKRHFGKVLTYLSPFKVNIVAG